MSTKTITVKSSTEGILTIAPNTYPLGVQRSGVSNYRITNIPKEITNATAIKIVSSCVLPANRFQITWDEIKEGGAILRNAPGRPPLRNAPKEQLTTRIDAELKQLAKESGLNLAELLENAIEQALQNR